MLSTVRTTPAHSGIPSRMLNAKAVPSTAVGESETKGSWASFRANTRTEDDRRKKKKKNSRRKEGRKLAS